MNREVLSLGAFPCLPRRGGRAIKKWSRSEKARTGWFYERGCQEKYLRIDRLTEEQNVLKAASPRIRRDDMKVPVPLDSERSSHHVSGSSGTEKRPAAPLCRP